MRKLIINIFILLLLLVWVDIGVGKTGSCLLNHVKESSYYGEINHAIKELKTDILIVGSSRAKSHYVPQLLMDEFNMAAYNAGSDGKNIFYHSCVINTVIHREKPKIIILDLLPGELQWQAYERLSVLNPFYNHDSLINETIHLKSSTEFLKMKSCLYRYNSTLLTLISNCIYKGGGKSLGYRKLHYTSKLPELKTTEPNDEPIDTNSVNRLLYVIDLCQRNNIQLFISISPYYTIMEEETPTITMLKNICNNNYIPFINNCQSSYFLQHPELFRDAFHLNHNGAEIYTKQIIADINHYQVNNLTQTTQ